MGALGERVKDHVNGIQFQADGPNAAKELSTILQQLVMDRSLLDKIQKSISNLPIAWMGSHAARLSQFYKETLTNQRKQPIALSVLREVNTFPLVWASFPSHLDNAPAPYFDPLVWIRLLKKKFNTLFG